MKLRTPQEVKAIFAANGLSVAEWARIHRVSYQTVCRMLNSPTQPIAMRGQAHVIAVLLGLKEGIVVEDDEELRERYIRILGAERVQYSRESLASIGALPKMDGFNTGDTPLVRSDDAA